MTAAIITTLQPGQRFKTTCAQREFRTFLGIERIHTSLVRVTCSGECGKTERLNMHESTRVFAMPVEDSEFADYQIIE